MNEPDTQPNPKYAKVEKATDSLLAKIAESTWSGAIVGAILVAMVVIGIWIAM